MRRSSLSLKNCFRLSKQTRPPHLATTKGYSHRIYLGKGIYGEVSLLYKEKDRTFIPHLFTYTDYQDKKCIEMFLKAREILKKLS